MPCRANVTGQISGMIYHSGSSFRFYAKLFISFERGGSLQGHHYLHYVRLVQTVVLAGWGWLFFKLYEFGAQTKGRFGVVWCGLAERVWLVSISESEAWQMCLNREPDSICIVAAYIYT
jgi:hypothetical protein